jgi:hypothetical protein
MNRYANTTNKNPFTPQTTTRHRFFLKPILRRSITPPAAIAATLICLTQLALGVDNQGTSSAHGLSVNTHLLDLNTLLGIGVDAVLAPTPTASGNAPAPFSVSNSVASASANASSALLGGGTISVSAGGGANLLTARASSTVDGLAGSRNAQGSAAVANFSSSLNLLGRISLLNSANVFNFGAQTLTSTASVSGDYGALSATGDSVIIDANGAGDGFATFSVLGLNFNLPVDAQGHAAPNTSLTINTASAVAFGDHLGTDLAGSIHIILNEQIVTGDGITSRGMEVNALHITFDHVGASFFNVLNVHLDDNNLVNGDIIVGHSQALLTAVPEPTSLCLLAAACGITILRRRSRLG